MKTASKDTVPALTLELYRLGELSPDEMAAVERRLTAEDREALERFELEDKCLLTIRPPARLAAEVERQTQKQRRINLAFLAAPALAAAAAVVFFALAPEPPLEGAAPATKSGRAFGEHAKGDARLLVYRRTDAGPTLIDDGAPVSAGDELQLGHLFAVGEHAMILSIDGRGSVTRHFPEPGEPTLVEAGKRLLDFAYRLDDAPRFERFFLVHSPQPFDTQAVLDAARSLAQSPAADSAELKLPKTLTQRSHLCLKETL